MVVKCGYVKKVNKIKPIRWRSEECYEDAHKQTKMLIMIPKIIQIQKSINEEIKQQGQNWKDYAQEEWTTIKITVIQNPNTNYAGYLRKTHLNASSM